mmetsp:Transcript_348/g.673  ORF Transcript_348/g.673 Transcript_348/m.673 type:complete len:167 (+) Transcript_348:59-559(+)
MMVAEEEMKVAAPAPSQNERYLMDHRALLFGSRFGRSTSVNSKGKVAAAAYAAAEQEELQKCNEELAEQLSSKVEELREISLSIADEVTESAKRTEDMDRHFGRAAGWLREANSRLQTIAKAPASRHMCSMALFACGLMLLLFIFGRVASRGSAGAAFLAPSGADP